MTDDAGEVVFSGPGLNYRSHEFINVFTVSQLSRFEAMNEQRKQMAGCLTVALAELPCVEGPHTPDYPDPVYFSYLWEARPEGLGLDVPASKLRKGLCKALAARGVPAHPAQALPVPVERVFQAKLGYGRGSPSKCHAREVTYNIDDYPGALQVCASRAFAGGVYPPGDMNLMKLYADALTEVLEHQDRVSQLAEEEICAVGPNSAGGLVRKAHSPSVSPTQGSDA